MDMRKIIKDAFKSNELQESLQNISHDDNMGEVSEFTDTQIVDEAVYVLGCFSEGGHSFCDGLTADDAEERKYYKSEKKTLQAFIKKYQDSASGRKYGAEQIRNEKE